jgi:hypothetical protein
VFYFFTSIVHNHGQENSPKPLSESRKNKAATDNPDTRRYPMQCARCKQSFKKEDLHKHNGSLLCEECYMDALSPARSCDPWARNSAKNFVRETGSIAAINETQARILGLLKRNKSMELSVIAEALEIAMFDLKREIATLHHLEKVRPGTRDGKMLISLW